MSRITTLVLLPDNPTNCEFIDTLDDETAYEVRTVYNPQSATITTVRNGAGAVIGSFEWKDVRSDVVTFGADGVTMSSGDWLKKSRVPFKDTVTFEDSRGKTFKWKGNSPGLSLSLFIEDDKQQPVARFQKAHRILDKSTDPPTQVQVAAQLLLDERANEIRNEVVLSFILLEKSRRARESSTNNRADADGIPVSRSYAHQRGEL
ncbi:hypothetical protein BDV98DRAFT_362435 [Pterulicium gracile]|uniref:DUF6593 domain-containing protein n=1 Tax=Pterulicium gracile TaxID=1884261 RepID=A0A5C3QQA6_9AGAR|nr:hypothetical protein BDV98DRAFT_362435 [Pterula gracilis]